MIELYLALASGLRKYNPARPKYIVRDTVWQQPPNGEKLGDYPTKELAFEAMDMHCNSLIEALPSSFAGFHYTFTKERSDGLYVAFFDGGRGKDKNGCWCDVPETCVEFILIYAGGEG